MKGIIIAVAFAVTGCAAIEPDAIRLETVHESHLTQHAPFTSHPEDYGMNQVAIAARWQQGHIVEEISEGYAFHGLDGCYPGCPTREVFSATIAYEWKLK